MKTTLEKSYIVEKAADEEQRAMNIVNTLFEALGDMCQATETDACGTMRIMIKLCVEAMKGNGHGQCALDCLVKQMQGFGEDDGHTIN